MLGEYSLSTQNNLFQQFAIVEFVLGATGLTTNKKTQIQEALCQTEKVHQIQWRDFEGVAFVLNQQVCSEWDC